MNTILRYPINKAINDIELPVGFEVLNVGVCEEASGAESISVWCKVETEEPPLYKATTTEKVRFLVFGTGANLDDMMPFEHKYIGTVQKSDRYAFHVFMVKN